MEPLRTHLSYANVVATLALVFAMSGGALAAHHYLITSTKQISPKVLRKLKGNRGPKGADGATGNEGAKGVAGQSALLPLPSGQSESGDYAMQPANTSGTSEYVEAVTFPIRLAAVIPVDNAVWTTTTTAHCSGPGHADPGYLCVYSQGLHGADSPEIRNYEGPFAEGTGHFGFYLEWPIKAAEASDIGTYTVTAP
jgi:hypothetical protein